MPPLGREARAGLRFLHHLVVPLITTLPPNHPSSATGTNPRIHNSTLPQRPRRKPRSHRRPSTLAHSGRKGGCWCVVQLRRRVLEDVANGVAENEQDRD